MSRISTGSSYWLIAAALVFATAAPDALAKKRAAAAPEAAAATADAPAEPSRGGIGVTGEMRAASVELDTAVRTLLTKSGPTRQDGFVYAMDVAPLMLYAAQRRDPALYAGLLPYAQKLIVSGGDDPNTDAFVLWRQKEGEKPEVSGSTEAIWMARALWTGAQTLERSDDRALALRILVGYGRHARVKQGQWRVSKYYAFSSKTYSDISMLSSYAPDFLAETEAYAHGAADMAQRSYALLKGAVSPVKLLYPVIHPEISSSFAHVSLNAYGPNNVVSLADSCTAAEASLKGAPQIARGVMEFVGTPPERRDDNGRLFEYFDRTTGVAVGETALGGPGYGCLARIAVATNDGGRLEEFEPIITNDIQGLAAAPNSVQAPLYAAGPLLLTALAMGAFAQGQ